MRRSITALICGLIGSLFSLFWGFAFGVGGNFLGIFNSAEAQSLGATLTTLGWVAFLGAIVGIVGAALSVKQARKGAICLSIAAVACGILQLYLFAKTIGGLNIMTTIIIFLLPTILLIVAAVFAWLAKEGAVTRKTLPEPQKFENNSVTLEKELENLKSTLDKGLITDDEYKEAKKALLEKYTK